MLCKRPYAPGGSIVGSCRTHCVPCRINTRREWTARVMLESMCHQQNVWVTLTYNDQNLPEHKSLVKDEISKFAKRLRRRMEYALNKEINPNRHKCYKKQTWPIKYFGCGEYGTNGNRPHYHIIIFGVGPEHAKYIEDSWRHNRPEKCWLKKMPRGYIAIGDVTKETAQYTAGYVMKKLKDDWIIDKPKNYEKMSTREKKEYYKDAEQAYLEACYGQRVPEYQAQSKSLGLSAVESLAVAERDENAIKHRLEDELDVHGLYKIGSQSLPIGRYLKEKMREELGINEEKKLCKTTGKIKKIYKTSQEKRKQTSLKMQVLREEAQANPKCNAKNQAQAIKFLYQQKVASIEKRQSIYNKRNTI